MIHEFAGSARERGRQHGRALAPQIRARIGAALPPLDPRARADLARPWWRAIESHDHGEVALADELRGIAEGAGADLDAVVLLNAFEAFAIGDQVELGGCTSVGIGGAGGALIAQNWDANPSLAGSVAVHVHRGSAATTVVLASPGGLGWIGMSSHGVALATNDLVTPSTRHGLPSQAVRRHALAAPDAELALAAILATPAVGGRTYLLGDRQGRLITVELAAETTPRVRHDAGPTAHTNHALAPEVAAVEDATLLRATYPSSHRRLARARALLSARPALDPPARAGSVLGDHEAHPLSICRHPAPEEQTVTAASATFDCATGHATFALGPPCSTPATIVTVGPPR